MNYIFNEFDVNIRSAKNGQWEAFFPELPKMSATGGNETHAIITLYAKWHRYQKKSKSNDETIPITASKKEYSGHINLRIEPRIHKTLVIEAIRCGVSLNSLISKKLEDSIDQLSGYTNFYVAEVEISYFSRSAIIFLTNQNNQNLGLKFSLSNLGDELSDSVAKSKEQLKKLFSTSPLNNAVQYFISQELFINQDQQNVQVIECVLVSYKSIRASLQNDDIVPKPEGEGYVICRRV